MILNCIAFPERNFSKLSLKQPALLESLARKTMNRIAELLNILCNFSKDLQNYLKL